MLIHHREKEMADITEEWKQQERRIINEFFKTKVPKALGSRQNNEPIATQNLLGSKSTGLYGRL